MIGRAMAVVLASTAVGCGGVSEEGPEPTTEVDGLASVDDLETDETSLFWASGEIGRVSFGGGATRLGGESVCDVESNGEWLYYLDGGAGGFVAADSGGLDVDEPTLVVTNVSVSGRTPRCGTLALTPTQAFLVVAAFGDESQMLNAPLGVGGAAITDLTGESIVGLVADDDAVYYANGDGQIVALLAGTGERQVLVDAGDASALRLGEDRIYWRQRSVGADSSWQLRSIRKDGSALRTLVTVKASCNGLGNYTIDDTHAYFGFNVDREDSDEGCDVEQVVAVARVPLGGGEREIVAQRRSIESPERFAVGGGRVFFSDISAAGATSIRSLPLP